MVSRRTANGPRPPGPAPGPFLRTPGAREDGRTAPRAPRPGGAGRPLVRVAELTGGIFDGVEQVGDPAVVGFELVDHRTEPGRVRPHRREEQDVLVAVVTVDEPAVTQAVHSQLPQRPARLQRLEPRPHLVGGSPTGDVRGQRPAFLAARRAEGCAPTSVLPAARCRLRPCLSSYCPALPGPGPGTEPTR